MTKSSVAANRTARNADLAIVIFNFDFGQTRLCEQFSQLADQIDIDVHAGTFAGGAFAVGHDNPY